MGIYYWLFLDGRLGCIAGSSPDSAASGVYAAALWNFGVGDNLRVDLSIFVECIISLVIW